MKIRFPLSLFLVSAAIYFGVWGNSRADASLFGASEIDDSEAVAIAVPINDGESYNLVILEQLNQQRQCWREQGNSPTVIDPLLLNFDFTGICGRSTDSNGYSIRLGGEDMAWRYDLRLVFEQNELKLKAFNADNPWRSPIEVGSTQGLGSGMLKIHLNEGWTLGKRTYEGKKLGHIYMVNERSVNQLVANLPSRSSSSFSSSSSRSTTTPSQQVEVASSNGAIQIFVPPSQPSQPAAIAVPEAPTTSQRSGLSASTNGLAPLPVPNSSIPTRNSDSSGYVRLNGSNLQPPPPPISLAQSLGLKYRVIVDATTSRQKDNLKRVVPDAFHTWVGDRRLMQAGAFADEVEARELQERLREAGLSSEIVSIR